MLFKQLLIYELHVSVDTMIRLWLKAYNDRYFEVCERVV